MEFEEVIPDNLVKFESVIFEEKDELLSHDDPEEIYRRRKDEEKTSISWGQRKLLLMLISFFTKHLDKEDAVIVYAGAAPGYNISIVSKLFPRLTWHLYDPVKSILKTEGNIIVYRKKFTDETAHYWRQMQEKDKNIYFISDIRTADYTKASNLEENEKQIIFDMKMQRKWVEIIKPCKAHLKFRLPYVIDALPKTFEYFDGIIYKQSWAPQTSTETRLVIPSSNLTYKEYSCEKYQSQMFYHNIVIREKNKYCFYINDQNDENKIKIMDSPELLDDYDSCCEIFIWTNYLRYRKKEITKENIIELSRNATKMLTQNRKYSDTLSYLRANPRAIKSRNFQD